MNTDLTFGRCDGRLAGGAPWVSCGARGAFVAPSRFPYGSMVGVGGREIVRRAHESRCGCSSSSCADQVHEDATTCGTDRNQGLCHPLRQCAGLIFIYLQHLGEHNEFALLF